MTPNPLARISRTALDEARTLVRLDAVPSTDVMKGPTPALGGGASSGPATPSRPASS